MAQTVDLTRPGAALDSAQLKDLYLDLLKKSLTRAIASKSYSAAEPWLSVMRWWFLPIQAYLRARGWSVVKVQENIDVERGDGRDWPADAETMVGFKRLDNLRMCVERVVADGIAGDLIETGVWRGGASIFMCGVLKANGDLTRIVWLADSFEGLPKAQPGVWKDDERGRLSDFGTTLAVSLEDVRANFERYGLLDDRVRFLKGWFKDTLPSAPIEKLSLLRLDGDMYESTIDALDALYPKLSPGGFCIVDDYVSHSGARQAVDDYRKKHGITEPIEAIDWAGAFWRRSL